MLIPLFLESLLKTHREEELGLGAGGPLSALSLQVRPPLLKKGNFLCPARPPTNLCAKQLSSLPPAAHLHTLLQQIYRIFLHPLLQDLGLSSLYVRPAGHRMNESMKTQAASLLPCFVVQDSLCSTGLDSTIVSNANTVPAQRRITVSLGT